MQIANYRSILLKFYRKREFATVLLVILLIGYEPHSQALADESVINSKDAQFNFDDDYVGEEISGDKNSQLIYDPFENFNRKVFGFNEFVDKNIALPAVKKYRQFTPKVVRDSVHNFLNNISLPFVVINSILQGNSENSMASFSSFLINTTLGIGGFFDIAGNKKIKYNDEDFGQTIGKYGVKSGAYLVIPLIGPINVRDLSGFAVEKIVNPFSFVNTRNETNQDLLLFSVSLSLIQGLDTREGLIEVVDDIRKNSFDTYATVRSAYSQRRNSLVLNK